MNGNDICDVFCPSAIMEVLKVQVPELKSVVDIFKLLSDESRVKIVYLLGLRELCVCDLASALEMSLPAISHHLRLLRAHKLVESRRDGKMVYYKLKDTHIMGMIREAQDVIV